MPTWVCDREFNLAQGEEILPNYMISKKVSLPMILRKFKLFGNFYIIIYVFTIFHEHQVTGFL